MSKPFPTDNRFLNGNFAPWLMEGDSVDLVVEGEIPRELAGAFFRNGSNPQFAPGSGYHWFVGDGMIHAFYFEDGHCSYRNRWVRTDRFELERREGRSLFGGIAGAGSPDPLTEGVSGNSSNTNVIWHAGKLLSLWEAGPPYEIDPPTLDTTGIWNYDGRFKRERFGQLANDIMTAHPKLDPDTGELVAFGYSPMPPHLVYHVIDREGRLIRSEEIDVPYPSMMHDFVVSSEHALFPVMPAAFNLEKLAETGSAIAWEPERGSHIGILPRSGSVDDIVWVEKEPSFCFHYVNAVTTGSTIVADVWHLPSLGLFDEETQQGPASPPILHRWTIDLDGGTLKDEALDDAAGEFGRVDERYAGKPYRHMWSLGSLGVPESSGAPEQFNSIFHYDMQTRSRTAHKLTDGSSFGEPVFVPRSPDAAEGDGFVITIVFRPAENRSDLLILDAQNVEQAPYATVKLPHRIPFGFHGNWRPAY